MNHQPVEHARGPSPPEEHPTRRVIRALHGKHVVQFYESHTFLCELIADFICAGMEAREPVIIVTTRAHRERITQLLDARCIHVENALKLGRLAMHDAEEVLELFMVDGEPHWELFHKHVGGMVRSVRSKNQERTLRAFGEMVDLLWKQCNVRAALQLETMWNELAKVEELSLLCGYELDDFRCSRQAADFARLCDLHSHVTPSETFSGLLDEQARLREIVRLQHRALALEAEIDRREALERTLQDEREKLRQLFMQSPALIVITRGADHVFDFINSGCAKLLGKDDILGRSLGEVIPDLSVERRAVLDRIFLTGERHVEDTVRSVRDWSNTGSASERFFSMVFEPYRDPRGRVEGIMAFGFDVTEQVLAKRKVEAVAEELETANRTKDEFLAAVSHELRTPLNAILGWVRMLRSDTLPFDKRSRALEVIERNAHVQTQLIEDLLDVSRIVSGKLRLDITAVELPAVVDNAIDALRPTAAAKCVTLTQTLDPSASPILGDANRLQQIVWNLLTNAVKFTPRGGSVHVALHRFESSVELLVTDTGDGIPSEFLPHVFDQFRQADATTTRKHGGLGIGLSIVRSLVELHGGGVSVESDGPGRGSTFAIRLPISPLRSSSSRFERSQPLRVSGPLGHNRELDGVHVLVVDDEPDARELLAELLTTTSNATVTTTGSVAEAMDVIRDAVPDVIVSDIGMPGEDGYDLIRQLRALPSNRGGRTPAVALTAYARVEDRTKALIAGFNMHVPKPVEPAELLAVLSSLALMFASRDTVKG